MKCPVCFADRMHYASPIGRFHVYACSECAWIEERDPPWPERTKQRESWLARGAPMNSETEVRGAADASPKGDE